MLYRKYRPQTFSEVVGQQHVVQTLQGALASGRVGHAYLFAGPRGTGKTTIARLLAKALNCEHPEKDGNPDNRCSACIAINNGSSLDLIEIDAASNRGIDEIRNLKESALVAAPTGKNKIFIVDEVHMLTKDAFNALLKILEEPPSHVVFALATTEPQKVLPTVLSRVQRFDFRRLTPAEIFEKLKRIAATEKLKIQDDALLAIANASDGAARDGEVLLSKLQSYASGTRVISSEDVQSVLGLVPASYHPEFLGYLASYDRQGALSFVEKLHHGGIDLEHFTAGFLDYVRKVLITKVSPATLASVGAVPVKEFEQQMSAFAQQIEPARLVKILTTFSSARVDIKHSPIPQLPLELAVIELTEK